MTPVFFGQISEEFLEYPKELCALEQTCKSGTLRMISGEAGGWETGLGLLVRGLNRIGGGTSNHEFLLALLLIAFNDKN